MTMTQNTGCFQEIIIIVDPFDQLKGVWIILGIGVLDELIHKH